MIKININFDRYLILITIFSCLLLYSDCLYGVFSGIEITHETELIMAKFTNQTLTMADLNLLHDHTYFQSRFLGTFANIVFCLSALYQFVKCFINLKESWQLIFPENQPAPPTGRKWKFYTTLVAVIGGIAFVFVGVSQYGAQQPQMGALYISIGLILIMVGSTMNLYYAQKARSRLEEIAKQKQVNAQKESANQPVVELDAHDRV